jgi:hypothetical protein
MAMLMFSISIGGADAELTEMKRPRHPHINPQIPPPPRPDPSCLLFLTHHRRATLRPKPAWAAGENHARGSGACASSSRPLLLSSATATSNRAMQPWPLEKRERERDGWEVFDGAFPWPAHARWKFVRNRPRESVLDNGAVPRRSERRAHGPMQMDGWRSQRALVWVESHAGPGGILSCLCM